MTIADIETRPRAGPSTAVRQRQHAWLALAFSVVCLAPVVITIVHLWSRSWVPSGDWALLELRTRDVGHDTPLIGPYSRYGWSHPGPLLYWTLAGPYWLRGGDSIGILVGAGLVNLGSVAGSLAVAWRRGGIVLVGLLAFGASVLLHSLKPPMLIDPWNPWITVLPFLLFMFLIWACSEGDRWAMPVAVYTGSFLVQTHVGYALLVATGAGWAIVSLLGRARRVTGSWRSACDPRRLRHLGGWGVATVIVLCAVWAPPLIDELRGTHNLSEIARHFAGANEAVAGFGTALGITTRETSLGAAWYVGREPINAFGGGVETRALTALVLPVLIYGLAMWFGFRTRARRARSTRSDTAHAPAHVPDVTRHGPESGTERGQNVREDQEQPARDDLNPALRLQAFMGVMALAGTLAVSRISDAVYEYLIRWWWPLAMAIFVSVAWTTWTSLDARLRRAAVTPLAALLVVGTTLMSLSTITTSDDIFLPVSDLTTPITTLTNATVGATADGETILVREAGSGIAAVHDGVRLQLERNGRHIVVPHDRAYRWGDRDADVHRPDRVLWIVSGDAILDWNGRDDMTKLAEWDPLPADERSQAHADFAAIRDQFIAVGNQHLVDNLFSDDSLIEAVNRPGVDQDLLRRVDDWRRRGRPYAAFLERQTG